MGRKWQNKVELTVCIEQVKGAGEWAIVFSFENSKCRKLFQDRVRQSP